MKTVLDICRRQWKVISAVAVLMILSWGVYQVLTSGELPPLPKTIFRLALTSEIHGEAARQQVNQLYEQIKAPQENEVGTYMSPDGCGTLYLSLYATDDGAADVCRSVKDGLLQQTSQTVRLHSVTLDKIHYIMYMSGGKVHYLFSYRHYVCTWIADPTIAQASLHDLLKLISQFS